MDQDLRGFLRDGRGFGCRSVISVWHQLEPILGRARQRRRTDDRLRGASRFLSRGDVSQCAAIRLGPGAAMAAHALGHRCRGWYTALGVLDLVGQQLDADAGGIRDARRYRLSARLARHRLQSELPVPPGAYGDGGVSDDIVRGARRRRTIPPRRQTSGIRPHHGPHGRRLRRHRRAAAALHRRPARSQYARASAAEDRGDRGALGQQPSG